MSTESHHRRQEFLASIRGKPASPFFPDDELATFRDPSHPPPAGGEASFAEPWSPLRSHIHIPATFSVEVSRHLIVHLSSTRTRQRPPLILAIQGRPGDGKTEMVTECCVRVGCNTFCMSGAALSGKHEGDARVLLLKLIADARRRAIATERPSVLIIDDIDRSIAALSKNTGHTVNSALLIGALHDLANQVHSASDDMPLSRVPVVMTGNDFSTLPETLTRPGRTRFFSWCPTWREKADMALPLFGARNEKERKRLRWLVWRYHRRGQPLAFFVQLAGEYLAAATPLPGDCRDILEAAAYFARASQSALDHLDFSRLNRLARQLHRETARSFLQREERNV